MSEDKIVSYRVREAMSCVGRIDIESFFFFVQELLKIRIWCTVNDITVYSQFLYARFDTYTA